MRRSTRNGLEITSVSGHVRVKSLRGDLTARTVSGDMSLTYPAGPGRLDVESTSGSVTLHLPAGASFILDAHSTSGDIRCRFPITISQSADGGGRHALAGTVGAGAGRIQVRTVSGDMRIEP